ncbi:AsmA-like protein [Chitinophaga skermanii]|uniref:AsmA-like protein n=1 Tax=Chitinophaga skermanii TaxID=331697 RepID=A0A327QCY4_9BACT|nr:AsmA-like C-terminal region-containing protein [Chitinophaga skermanii]RAJ02506.1 AsmA-like protein [Chitinophaga skermanii]
MKFKKILKRTLIVFVVLIAILIAIPFLFKGKIMSKVKAELNKSLNAKVDFKDVDISLIRRFPRLAVAIEDLSIVGVQPFEGDTLLSVHRIDLALNLMSAIKGEQIDVYNVTINQPRVRAIVHKDGRPNWDIMKPDTVATPEQPADTSSSTFKMNLQKYSIEDAYVLYSDQQGDMSLIINDLDHSGAGDFTLDEFILKTKTSVGGITFNMGLIPYLVNTKAVMDADIKIDNKTSTYSFKTDNIALNNLKISAGGFVQILEESMKMDLQFKSASTDFKDILSMVPAVFMQDFSNLKTSGSATFGGFVKGTFSDTQMPAFGIDLGVKDGFFQYPNLPKPVKNIQLAVHVNNPDGVPDHTVIDMPQAHLEFDNSPVDIRLLVKTPISDAYIDAAAKTNLDLSKIMQFVPLEKGTQLKGFVNADLQAKGNMSAIEKQAYDKFYAAGDVKVNDLLYASKDYPDGVKVNNLHMIFNPKTVNVPVFDGAYLGTNFTANGEVNNMLAYVLKNQPLNGKLNVKADAINLDKFMATGSEPAANAPAEAAAEGPFVVPNNLDFTLNAQAGKVHYDKVDLTNLSGTLLLKDETVYMTNIKGNALQGTMNINGSYSTKESHKNPAIHLKYDVQDVDIQQSFLAFNTVQKLMPIAQFLSGKISSSLNLEGKLGEDMSPVLNTLTGDGNLLLIQGVLKKFEPLDQLASQLNIAQLKDISVRDIKNYIAFQNGRVTVNPFKIKTNGLDILVGGSHGFDQSLDYTLQLNVPRSVIGKQGDALINNLVNQATSKGIPVKVSDSVHLQIALGGNILKPSFKTDLRETSNKMVDNLKDQAANLVKNKVDSAKATIKDSIAQVKKDVSNAIKDEVTKQLLGGGSKEGESGQPAQDAGKKVTNTLNNTLNGLLKKKKAAPADSTHQ